MIYFIETVQARKWADPQIALVIQADRTYSYKGEVTIIAFKYTVLQRFCKIFSLLQTLVAFVLSV